MLMMERPDEVTAAIVTVLRQALATPDATSSKRLQRD
jgi:hypothetical protein